VTKKRGNRSPLKLAEDMHFGSIYKKYLDRLWSYSVERRWILYELSTSTAQASSVIVV